VQAIDDMVRGLRIPILFATHQLESVGVGVHTDILKNVPVLQPRIDDGKPVKAGRLLQDSNEGKYVWMRDVLPPCNLTIETLMRIRLSSLPHLSRDCYTPS